MKVPIVNRSAEDLLKTHSIRGCVEGWFYKTYETSANAWIAEGVDLWGRKVVVRGTDPDKLLAEAESAAQRIQDQLEGHS